MILFEKERKRRREEDEEYHTYSSTVDAHMCRLGANDAVAAAWSFCESAAEINAEMRDFRLSFSIFPSLTSSQGYFNSLSLV